MQVFTLALGGPLGELRSVLGLSQPQTGNAWVHCGWQATQNSVTPGRGRDRVKHVCHNHRANTLGTRGCAVACRWLKGPAHGC